MLRPVHVGTQSLDLYRKIAGDAAVDELRSLARPLKGVRVLQLNATSYGGGVSELLRSAVPLLNDLGLDAEWRVMTAEDEFFQITKWLHNALQGAAGEMSRQQKAAYLRWSEANAAQLTTDRDVYVTHDPQPAALRSFLPRCGGVWVWRCHIDTSRPNPSASEFLRPVIELHDSFGFTLDEFVPGDLDRTKITVIPPSIDPLSPKNLQLPRSALRQILNFMAIRQSQPQIPQVSRFDSWKDPLGVIAAYRLVKREVLDVALNLIGSMALDDPEAWQMYTHIQAETQNDPDLHVFTNLTGVSNIEVNAFQTLSDVIIQKSIREGFGLVVSESLWKGTPVVAGRTGGIPMQIGEGGYLVDRVEEAADRLVHLLRQRREPRARLVHLLRQRRERRERGRAGREHVRQHFLITRVLRDILSGFVALSSSRPSMTAA